MDHPTATHNSAAHLSPTHYSAAHHSPTAHLPNNASDFTAYNAPSDLPCAAAHYQRTTHHAAPSLHHCFSEHTTNHPLSACNLAGSLCHHHAVAAAAYVVATHYTSRHTYSGS